MLIDDQTAILICSGPSLDRLSPRAWAEIHRAGAVVAINGALVAEVCVRNEARWTYVSAMDINGEQLSRLPGFLKAWEATPAWRLSAAGTATAAEAYVYEVEYWSEMFDEGYKGGSTAMVATNWLCNVWPDEPHARNALQSIAQRAGKPIGPRGFKKLAYLGLDMQPGQGGHARGAGIHASGFADSPVRDRRVRRGWRNCWCEAHQRNIQLINLTPDSGLQQLPHADLPKDWLLD